MNIGKQKIFSALCLGALCWNRNLRVLGREKNGADDDQGGRCFNEPITSLVNQFLVHYTKRAISFSPRRRRRFPKGKKKKVSGPFVRVCATRKSPLAGIWLVHVFCTSQWGGGYTQFEKNVQGGREERGKGGNEIDTSGRTDGRTTRKQEEDGKRRMKKRAHPMEDGIDRQISLCGVVVVSPPLKFLAPKYPCMYQQHSLSLRLSTCAAVCKRVKQTGCPHKRSREEPQMTTQLRLHPPKNFFSFFDHFRMFQLGKTFPFSLSYLLAKN